MFTGLVEMTGTIRTREERTGVVRFSILPQQAWRSPLFLGESISVSGVCLTVVDHSPEGEFSVDVGPETLERTRLGTLQQADAVNLERSLSASDRLGGHLVTGHVDGTATVLRLEEQGDVVLADLLFPPAATPYLAPKGSVALEGVSLTVNAVRPTAEGVSVQCMWIPHTRAITTLGSIRVGDKVHYEVDLLSRYVVQALASREQTQGSAP